MMFPPKEIVERIRQQFPSGCRIVLDAMNDAYRTIPAGTQGTVIAVDDIGTIHVSWDTGSSLGVVYGLDKIEKVQ